MKVVKRIPGLSKTPTNGSSKAELKSKTAEIRTLDRQRRFRNMQAGLRAIASEMKRVTWPSRDEWVAATLVVIGLVVIVAVWTRLISYLVELFLGNPS
jgi:preprotein translocase SecE subunit